MSQEGGSQSSPPSAGASREKYSNEVTVQTPVSAEHSSGVSPPRVAVDSPRLLHDVTLNNNKKNSSPQGQPSRKRARPDTSRPAAVYPRKRSTAACRVCRTKKIKCNNARPSCQSCLTSKAECVYGDPQDHSSFDQASLLILDRLNDVLEQLGQLQTTRVGQSDPGPAIHSEVLRRCDGDAKESPLHIPAAKTAPDAVLQWPVFDNMYPQNYLTDAAFVAMPFDEGNGASGAKITAIDEDAILEDVQRFLDLVHTKNPVLDVDTLLSYTRDISENGLRWDAISCLVLLACALGCVAQPFILDSAVSAWTTSTTFQSESYQRGKAYYNMARKRIGLVGTGILGAQCHFLAGIYLMYTLRPFDGWSDFRSASQLLYMHIQRRSRLSSSNDAITAKDRQIEQRLYWSCYKSECEFRVELPLPNGILADLDYPDMHPSPPDIRSLAKMTPMLRRPSLDSDFRQQLATTHQQEQSWLYYLTEITLRRMANRILNTFYADGSMAWTGKSIVTMMEAAQEFEHQLQEWYNALPSPIQFRESESATEELPFMARGRFMEIKTWLYRPFLYYAIHNAHDAPRRAMVDQFVEKALFYNFLIAQEDHTRHRHHGTWYSTRARTSAMLCIIGAVRSGQVRVPPNWEDVVRSGIASFKYWESEALGLQEAIEVLENLMILRARVLSTGI